MHTEICPDCDGSGSIERDAGGPSGHSTMRLHPVGFGYQHFAYSQVWEPRRRRTRTEECETCHGEGWLSNQD